MCVRFRKDMSEMMLSADMDSPMGIITLLYHNMCAMADLRERLKHYEDLEEQGRLLKLPCKVGDTVWNYSYFGLRKYKVTHMGFNRNGLLYFECRTSSNTYNFRCYLEDFKDIFLTEAEAEAKRAKENEK